jgi:hypothetical protein
LLHKRESRPKAACFWNAVKKLANPEYPPVMGVVPDIEEVIDDAIAHITQDAIGRKGRELISHGVSPVRGRVI